MSLRLNNDQLEKEVAITRIGRRMSQSSKQVIAHLQRDRRFMGTCPRCDADFRLSDAVLYSIGGSPPEEAVAAIRSIREVIAERKADLKRARERMTLRAQTTAEAVNLGKIVEKIVPSFASFKYFPGDCRALFEPIDYVVFSGLSGHREIDAIHFVDVKSGSARLGVKQKTIKDVVEKGAVKFKLTKA